MHHLLDAYQRLKTHAGDLDVVMPMYNLIEYSKNYSEISDSLLNYYRGKSNGSIVGDTNYSIRSSKFFDYKTGIAGKLEGPNTKKKFGIAMPLKYLSDF